MMPPHYGGQMHTRTANQFLPLLMLLLAGSVHTAVGQAATVDVGGRLIVVPNPGDFVRSDGVNVVLDKASAALIPASNRSLISFSTKDYVDKLKQGEVPEPQRSFNIQVVRTIESREIGEKTFAGLRDEARAEIEKLRATLDAEVKKVMASGNRKLSGEFGPDIALTVSDTAVLGFFDQSPSSLGFTMAMKVGLKSGGNTPPAKRLVASIMTPVNGRLLNLYAYSDYGSEADRQWAEKAVSAWRDAIRDANPKVQGPTAGLFDFGRVGRSALMGGIIGGAVGLVIWLLKRKKKDA
jgi:hypothetical protein